MKVKLVEFSIVFEKYITINVNLDKIYRLSIYIMNPWKDAYNKKSDLD